MHNRYTPQSFLDIVKYMAMKNHRDDDSRQHEVKAFQFLMNNADTMRTLAISYGNPRRLKLSDVMACFYERDISLEIAKRFRGMIADGEELRLVADKLDYDDCDQFIIEQHQFWDPYYIVEQQNQHEANVSEAEERFQKEVSAVSEVEESCEDDAEEQANMKRSANTHEDDRPAKKAAFSNSGVFAEGRKKAAMEERQPTHQMTLRSHK
jgi:hypothetical protein